MSDQGFGQYGAATQQQMPGFNISLDFGIEETGGLAGSKPPEGIHTWQVASFEGKMTNGNESALVLTLQIVDSPVAGAVGATQEEWIVFPGEQRKANDLLTWQKMMKMTRLKLEALTGRPWRENRMQLNASDIANRRLVIRVYHVEETYTKEDGEKVTTTKAKLADWTALHEQRVNNGNLGQSMGGWGAAPPAAQPQVAAAQATVPAPENGWGAQPGGGFTMPTGPGGAPVTYDQPSPTMQQAVQPSPEELAQQAALAAAAQQHAAQQSEQVTSFKEAGGTGFAFAQQANQQQAPPAQQMQPAPAPSATYDPAEEPF